MIRIDTIEFFPVEIPRTQAFKIATGVSEHVRNVVVKITSGEFTGWGASAPNSVTKETMESVQAALEVLAKALKGEAENISAFNERMEQTLTGNPSAKAGIDIALYDLLGKIQGQSTSEILGRAKECQLTDMTLGIDTLEGTVAEAKKWAGLGFKALKLKVGLDLNGDIERVSSVREAVGSGVRLWADANQGYSVEEAVKFCREVEHLDLEFLEQPVHVNDLEGLGRVKEASPIPIMADEAVKSSDDAREIARLGCADMINIKLMKCGGITNALEIARISEGNGMPNMIGCMGETMPSIAGALHFVLSQENVRYADLDSHFMLAKNIAEGIEFKDGCLYPSSGPGLGLKILQENL